VNLWTNYITVILIQITILMLVAHERRAIERITVNRVIKSAVVGIVLGSAFDVLVGQHLGFFSYTFHLTPVFLIVNGVLSYGTWLLTEQLIETDNFISFCAWNLLVAIVYESANFLFPVWSWTLEVGHVYAQIGVIVAIYLIPSILSRPILYRLG
jgi:hypothetical protein